MRLLVISYGFMLQRAYQWKAIALRERCESILVVIPSNWKEIWASRAVSLEPGPLEDVDHVSFKLRLNVNKHFALMPFKELRRVLRSFRPDVIEFDNEPFNLGAAQLMWAVRKHSPESRVYLHAAQNLLKRYPPPFNSLESYVFRHCAGVFARNQAAADVLIARGCSPSKVHQMGHGVSQVEFSEALKAQVTTRSSTAGAVLYVGALTHQKGVDTLLQACQRSTQFRSLVVAGSGPMEADLKALAERLGISAQCRFLGQVPQEHLKRLYGEASCLVFPSRTTPKLVEQFGRVLIEAMAAGCPIIASDSGNIPTVVGDAGLIVPEADHVALADRLDRLLSDDSLRDELRSRALERVRREYEWGTVADRMMDVFRSGQKDSLQDFYPRKSV